MVAAVTGFPARSRRRPHGVSAASRWYQRRRPEKTPLHKVVSENLESWLEWREAAERPVPGYVEDELRGYLECGLLCFGFARAVCTSCRTGFVVDFSCKGRGVCPSCNGRHMAQTAAHLADHKAANWVGPGRGRKSTRPGSNGVVEFSPFEFLDRLADLVPPPRKHRHRYHGVFAPNHRLIAFITEPGPIQKILTHLGEPLEPPPLAPARGPPTDWGELVQIHDDRAIFQASPDELPAIDIHSL